MSIRYDPPLLEALAAEIRERWTGRRVTGVWLDSESREVRLVGDPHDDGESLVFLLHPAAGHILVDRAATPPVGSGTWHGFRRLFLYGVHVPPDERLLVLQLAGGMRDVHADLPAVFELYVELHTNQWNAVLARGDSGRIEAVLWQRTTGGRRLRPGVPYVPPEGARSWATAIPSRSEWVTLLADLQPRERRAALLESVAWISSINVGWVLGPAATDPERGLLEAAFDRYLELRSGLPGPVWLLPGAEPQQPYPVKLEASAERFGDLLGAMRGSADRSGTWPGGKGTSSGPEDGPSEAPEPAFGKEAVELEVEIQRRLDRVRRRRAALERQLEGDDADRLRELGHLLLARQAEVPRGAERAELLGFDEAPIEVELDPRLDAVGNAERYYERARRRERAAAGIPGRIRQADARLAELEAGLVQLREEGPADELWQLAGGRPTPADAGVRPGSAGRPGRGEEALPYRRFRSSGGLEIRVGRSSRGNDELTFRHSSPDDIWLHARQAAGAHVIVRWDRRDQPPPRADLVEAAALAAMHSEARHSGLVAVDWTRRKYVRKPRKAPAGAVVPQRVSTLFVEPDPTIGQRLSIED